VPSRRRKDSRDYDSVYVSVTAALIAARSLQIPHVQRRGISQRKSERMTPQGQTQSIWKIRRTPPPRRILQHINRVAETILTSIRASHVNKVPYCQGINPRLGERKRQSSRRRKGLRPEGSIQRHRPPKAPTNSVMTCIRPFRVRRESSCIMTRMLESMRTPRKKISPSQRQTGITMPPCARMRNHQKT
jgi:hypothetical protein